MSKWHLYMIQCSDGTFYTGVTTDIARRIKEHNKADGKGSKYTRGRGPVKLVYKEEFLSKSEAFRREKEVKKLSRKTKISLFAGK
ncbi:MAG: GIY-YIG nuclease family protein [Candidatus Omnitrophica bacterium]|nr:GIY-YIG nuclease family protein [Candidatus Omnitrophota bacterium]